MILQPRADDLFAVEEVLRADEADHRIDQQRLELPGHGVRARFERLLVDAVMRVGRQAGALAGFEIHDVVAHRATPQDRARPHAPRGEAQGRRRSARFAASVPAMDWNTRSTGAPASRQRKVVVTWASTQDCVGISYSRMSRSTSRSRSRAGRGAVGGGVDADDGVAAAVHEAVEDRRRDARGIVGGVVRLEAHAERAGQPEVLRKRVTTRTLAGHQDQVLIAHELADGGDHLGRESGRDGASTAARRLVAQQPFAELADGQLR